MGAHASASPVRPPPSTSCFLVFLIISLLAITHIGTPVSGVTEAEALLKFKSSLTNQEAIPNWDPSTTPCSNGGTSKWVGVICEYGKVWGLQLQNMGLGGTPDIDALYQLSELRTLSFKNNKLEGPIPDLHRLPKLRSLFLTNNKFSGEIPEYVFAGMDSLRRVVLTNNAFIGKIPSSLATLPILVELKLDRNQFQGNIPDFQQKNLPSINVANNQLEGPLPARLTKLDAKLYSGKIRRIK